MFRYLSIGVLMLSGGAAMADGPSYSYIEGLYQEVDVDGGDGDGYTVSGSVAINESWYVFADYSGAELDAGPFTADYDRFALGAGWHSAISDKTDWFVSASYVNAELSANGFGSVDESGLGASIGIRSMFSPKLELSGALRYSDPEEETGVRAEAWYTLTGNFAIGLRAEVGDEINTYGLGIRLYFDK
ncbi:MAG: hypothetical protein ACR2QL_08970 [Woeseiaceae bacterium]